MGLGSLVLFDKALKGGGLIAHSLLMMSFAGGINTIYGAAYLLLRGTKRRDRDGSRQDPQVAPSDGSWPRARCLRLRRKLRAAVEGRLKYPPRFYLPWGGGQHGRYFITVVAGLAVSLALWYFFTVLLQRDMPVSLYTFCTWASNYWLSIWMVRKAFLRAGWPGWKAWKAFKRPTWAELAVPAIGLLGLGGLAIASGFVSSDGMDYELLTDPVVMALLLLSVVMAWQASFGKNTRLREEAFFVRELGEELGELKPQHHIYLSIKLAFWPSALLTFLSVAGFVGLSLQSGFPHVERWDLLVPGIGLYAVASLGGIVHSIASFEGQPEFNGIGSAAGIGFTFAWTWVFQRIGVEWFQLIGVAITLAGAVALAFTNEAVRNWARAVVHGRFGKGGGKRA